MLQKRAGRRRSPKRRARRSYHPKPQPKRRAGRPYHPECPYRPNPPVVPPERGDSRRRSQEKTQPRAAVLQKRADPRCRTPNRSGRCWCGGRGGVGILPASRSRRRTSNDILGAGRALDGGSAEGPAPGSAGIQPARPSQILPFHGEVRSVGCMLTPPTAGACSASRWSQPTLATRCAFDAPRMLAIFTARAAARSARLLRRRMASVGVAAPRLRTRRCRASHPRGAEAGRTRQT